MAQDEKFTYCVATKSHCKRSLRVKNCLAGRSFRVNAPAPLDKFAHTPKKSFATQSPQKLPRPLRGGVAVKGQEETFAPPFRARPQPV
jgi:hypothetical protein